MSVSGVQPIPPPSGAYPLPSSNGQSPGADLLPALNNACNRQLVSQTARPSVKISAPPTGVEAPLGDAKSWAQRNQGVLLAGGFIATLLIVSAALAFAETQSRRSAKSEFQACPAQDGVRNNPRNMPYSQTYSSFYWDFDPSAHFTYADPSRFHRANARSREYRDQPEGRFNQAHQRGYAEWPRGYQTGAARREIPLTVHKPETESLKAARQILLELSRSGIAKGFESPVALYDMLCQLTVITHQAAENSELAEYRAQIASLLESFASYASEHGYPEILGQPAMSKAQPSGKILEKIHDKDIDFTNIGQLLWQLRKQLWARLANVKSPDLIKCEGLDKRHCLTHPNISAPKTSL